MLVLVVLTLVIVAAVLLMAMALRGGRRPGLDLGAVSTRWLSELRRDEPWTR